MYPDPKRVRNNRITPHADHRCGAHDHRNTQVAGIYAYGLQRLVLGPFNQAVGIASVRGLSDGYNSALELIVDNKFRSLRWCMNAIPEVSSIAGFMEWVKDTLPYETEESNYAIFYRGHADEDYTVLPGVYRPNDAGMSHRNDESLMYHEMLRRDPAAFAEDRTTFERLARMQHHGLPTRLLDLTQSPLVALFFACEGCPEKNGQVLLFHSAQREVFHQKTLSRHVLAGVEYPLTFSRLGYDLCKYLSNFFDYENRHCIEHAEFNENYHNLLSACISGIGVEAEKTHDLLHACGVFKIIIENISVFYKTWVDRLKQSSATPQKPEETEILQRAIIFLMEFFNRLNEWQTDRIVSLCAQMHIQYKKEWRYLDGFLRELTYFYFVFPPMNNERLRRQRGAFLVCPPVKTDNWKIEHFQKPHAVRINANAKIALLKDLANQGVTRSYLFPELEEQARDIRLLYPPS